MTTNIVLQGMSAGQTLASSGYGGTFIGVSFTSYGMPFKYESDNWGAVTFHLEVYMRAVSGTAYSRLYNETDAEAVEDSELSTTETTMQRLRSPSLTLVDGKTYRVQFGKAGAHQGAFLGAKLVVLD